jgi:DNA-binding FadR family transcriptional regulator
VSTNGTADPWGPFLRPARSGNAFEETLERLLRLLRLGVVSAGDRLPPERELALRMGVSRETLRDALRSLREAGYLESRRGRAGGTFVLATPVSAPGRPRSLDARDVEDALALRFALETGAAELAARRALPAADRALLAGLQDECVRAPLEAYRPADSRLHLAVAELSGSTALAAAVAAARARANDLLDQIPLLPRNIEHSNRQHDRIVAAVLAGDPDRARAAMAEHLDGTAALLRAFLG